MTKKLKNILFIKDRNTSVLLFVLMLLTYLSKAPSDIVSYGQSDEIIRGAVTGAYLGSPMLYPLRLLIKLGSMIFPTLPAVSIGYGLSSIIGASSVGILYLIFSKLENLKKFPYKGFGRIYKIASVLVLGLSYYFMNQSMVIERYILVSFLLTLLVYLNLDQKTKDGLLYYIVLALGITYHWVFLVYLIVGVLYKLKNGKDIEAFKQSNIVKVIISVLVVWLLIEIDLNSFPNMTEYSQIRRAGFSNLIQEYKQTYLTDGYENLTSYNKIYIRTFVRNIMPALVQSMGYVVLGFVLLGAFKVYTLKNKGGLVKYLWLFAGFLVVMFIVSGMGAVGVNIESFVLILIIPQMFLTAFLWIGMLELSYRFRKASIVLESNKFLILASIFMVGSVLFYPLIQLPKINFNGVSNGVVARETLKSLDENSYIICFKDEICSSLIYVTQVEKFRDDVTVIPYWYHPDKMYLDLDELRPFGYNDYPYILHEIVTSLLNDDDKKLYAMGYSSSYWDFFAFDDGFLHFVPLGYHGELVKVTERELPTPSYPYLSLKEISPIRDPLKTRLISSLIQNRILNGSVYFKTGLNERGYNELNEASTMAYLLHPSDFESFSISRTNAESQKTNPFYKDSWEQEPLDRIIKESRQFSDNEIYDKAIDLINGAILLDPDDVAIRLLAGDIYFKSGSYDQAKKEYQNTLVLDPNNETALEKLKSFNL